MNQDRRDDYSRPVPNPQEDAQYNYERSNQGPAYGEDLPFEDISPDRPSYGQPSQMRPSAGQEAYYTNSPYQNPSPYNGPESLEGDDGFNEPSRFATRPPFRENPSHHDQTFQDRPMRGPQDRGPRPKQADPRFETGNYREAGVAYAMQNDPRDQRTGKQRRDSQRRGPGQMGQSKVAHQFPKVLEEMAGFFKGFFSPSPANALKQDLSSVSWLILLVANILLFSFAQATALYRSGAAVLDNLSLDSLLTGTAVPSWGGLFAKALLIQAIVLAILFLAAWLFAGLSGGQKLAPLQYLKMLSYATPLHSLISIAVLIFSIFATGFALTLHSMNNLVLFLSFIYVYDSVYPENRTSRYWLYMALLLVLSLVRFII